MSCGASSRAPTSTSSSTARSARPPARWRARRAARPSRSPTSSAPGASSRAAQAWQVDLNPLRGPTIEADLLLRDFTVNAIARPLAGGSPIDPFGGAADLAAGRLRIVAPDALEADPLRALRLVRLACELGLEPDDAGPRRRAPRRRGPAQRGRRAHLRRAAPRAGQRPADGGDAARPRAGLLRRRAPRAGGAARLRPEPLPPPRRPRPHARDARPGRRDRARPGAGVRPRARRRGRARCSPRRSPTS